MATYYFRCDRCLQNVIIEHGFDEEHPDRHDDCGGHLIRTFTMPNIIYRAGGFQTTDDRLTSDPDYIGETEY